MTIRYTNSLSLSLSLSMRALILGRRVTGYPPTGNNKLSYTKSHASYTSVSKCGK